MKNRFLKMVCLLGALTVFTLAASAQSPAARASVPFEFAAGGAMMAPGDYTVDIPVSGVMMLHGSTGSAVTLLTIGASVPTHATSAKLVFEKRDGMTFLAGAELPDESVLVVSPFAHVTKPLTTASLH